LIKGIYSFACHGKDTNQTSELAKNIQLLKAENIVFGVNGRRGKILDIPTLSLAAGRIIFVLGNNGAGKSSLLSFLAGRQYLPGASIWVKGRLLPPLSEKLMPGYRGIELIRQEPDLNPHFLVEEELERHLRIFDPGTTERKKKQYIKMFQLRSLLRQKTGSISGGERRRLALACAMVGEPELILLDEPFSDLDQPGRNLLAKLLLELAAEGIAFMIVSHHGGDAHWLADEIWTLDSGRIIERLHRLEVGFVPSKFRTASLLGMKNIFSTKDFPEIEKTGFRRIAFPENTVCPFMKGMQDLGDFQLIRKRQENGILNLMWKGKTGILFSSAIETEGIQEGASKRLGIKHQDILFLK